MRVAYYHEWSDGAESGVFKKIVSQVNHWAGSGVEVGLFNLSARDTSPQWRDVLDTKIDFEQVVWGSRIDRFRRMSPLVKRMLAWRPDIVYRRHGPWYPPFDRVARKARLVLEVNSDDLLEARSGAAHRYRYKQITRHRLLARAVGLVFVSHEVSKKQSFAGFQADRRVIANGIDLSAIKPVPAPDNETPRLFFMGAPRRPFHGTDKIVYLAGQFPDWRFDLVGPSPGDFDGSLPPNVTAHGVMVQNEYEAILSRADVAIASLALHRVGIHENSPLKMSEYVAWGIPVIVGYRDTNFMDPVDFILELPSAEDNVRAHLSRISEFVAGCRGKRVPREAIAHVGADHKERERLSFFDELIGAGA